MSTSPDDPAQSADQAPRMLIHSFSSSFSSSTSGEGGTAGGDEDDSKRVRTQSESAAWTRACFRMDTNPGGCTTAKDQDHQSTTTAKQRSDSVDGNNATTKTNGTAGNGIAPECLDPLNAKHDPNGSGGSSSMPKKNTWLQQGKISERASEILEDAKLALHDQQEKKTAKRLSELDRFSDCGGGAAATAAAAAGGGAAATATAAAGGAAENGDATTADHPTSQPQIVVPTSAMECNPANPSSAPQHQTPPPPPPPPPQQQQQVDNSAASLPPQGPPSSLLFLRQPSDEACQVNGSMTSSPRHSSMDPCRLESIAMYQEPVRWQGVLSKRSEWLRRLEKHFYVLEGKFLRRFSSKEAYIASRDEPFLLDDPGKAKRGSLVSAVSHLYILAGVKDSSSRVNGFTFITEDKKTLQLGAPTAVEKVIWMRLGLEAIVAHPELPLVPLDIEEFYAMLVVFYTAFRGNWKTEGDMAVTLPPPSEQVFSRFFRLLDKDVIFCSNYPPSVPFHGSFRGHSGVVRFMHEFAKHTAWTNFKIAGVSVEGTLAVASGQEELENRRDARRFVQNWVHKFTFTDDGRLARFEINGDVVAASAVFKIPGAATTLKLPQEFNEVDAASGKEGTMLVRVMQAHGLKMGSHQKRATREPFVKLSLVHQGKVTDGVGSKKQVENASNAVATTTSSTTTTTTTSTTSSSSSSSSATSAASSLVSSLSMPALSRKFSSGMNSLLSASSSLGLDSQSSDSRKLFCTGPPSEVSQNPANPVWNKVISLPFENVIGTCTLLVEVFDQQGKGGFHEIRMGQASINVSKYIMSAGRSATIHKEEEEKAMANDGKWYTISNQKGEYCGKVQVGMFCRKPVAQKRRLRKMMSGDLTAARMMRLDSPEEIWNPHATPAERPRRLTSAISGHNSGRHHGWTSVKLSPEQLARTKSASAMCDAGLREDNDGSGSGSNSGPNSASGSEAVTTASLAVASDAIACKENQNMHTFMVCGGPFTIPKHYNLIKVCGRGAYGIVIAATNMLTGGNVAIKKVIDCIWHPHQLKQILREVRLLRHLEHENILNLMDLIPPPSYQDFRDVYMTVDLMEMDLHRIIYSKEVLLDDHIRYFLYQLLSGLNHMHKAGVLHRDLKPSNLLINSDCLLKICDLGLARSKDLDDLGMTEYVVTRWYRAPELLLGSAYAEGVDVWAAGCIFAEMLGRKPLFPGETYVHQLQLIMNVLGVPEEHTFKENPMANKLKGRQLLSRTQAVHGIDVSTMFPNANPEALDLLWKMLVFDSEKRITVEQALRHPYLAIFYDQNNETRSVEVYRSFDLDGLDESELKELMFKEICHFHPEEMEKRAKHLHEQGPEDILPSGWVKRESRSIPGRFYYSNPKRGISTWNRAELN